MILTIQTFYFRVIIIIKRKHFAIVDNGCTIGVCPPCAKVRGYSQDDLLEGVNIVGSTAIHEPVAQGAAILSF